MPARRSFARLMLAGSLLLAGAGCLSRTALEARLHDDRATQADDWRARLASDTPERPRLAGALTLADALKIALGNNKALRAAVLEKEIADGRIAAAYDQALPTVSAQGVYTRLQSAPAAGAPAPDPFDRYSAGLQVVQPLYRGGAIGAALKAVRLYACWADEFIRGQTQNLIHETAAAYYDILLANRLEQAAGAVLESADSQLRTARDRAGQGVASRYDVLRAEVEAANARAEAIQAANRVRLTRARLFQILGVMADEPLAITGELAFEPVRVSRADILGEAIRRRPDLLQADLLIRLQRESLQSAKSRRYPAASAFLRHHWVRLENDAPAAGQWDPEWSAGLQVDWLLFDGFAREGQIAQERAILRRREAELEAAEERAWLDITQAIASLEDAEKIVESQRLNLDRAREALALAESGYHEGVNTAVELTDTRAALHRAEALLAQALHAHTLARLGLRRALGALHPDDEDPARLQPFQPEGQP